MDFLDWLQWILFTEVGLITLGWLIDDIHELYVAFAGASK